MKNVFFSSQKETEIFEKCYQLKLPLMIKGPTGCGKSQLVEYMSKELKLPLISVACNEDTNAADLLGRFIIKGGETLWQDGPVTRAAREGGILYLDEVAEAREDVIIALHPLSDHRREIYLDKINETVKAKDNFMLVTSFNPGYQQGLKELKPSTRQRFVNMTMNYLNVEKETLLIQELTTLPANMANKLAQIGAKIRLMTQFNFKATLSTRLLIYAATLIQGDMNPRMACHITIAEALSDDQEVVAALKDLINLNF